MQLNSFQKLPIKNKLIRLIMMITCLALLAATIISALIEIYLLKHSTIDNLNVLASAIAKNSTAAVTYEQAEAAAEILQALNVERDIEISAIYLNNKSLFAFNINSFTPQLSVVPQSLSEANNDLLPEGYYFTIHNNRLLVDLYHPITVNGQRRATLFIRSNLSKGVKLLLTFSLALLVIMLSITLIVYLVASRLQKFITEPLHHLAQTANRIAEEKDYSIRVEVQNKDEVGSFTDAFNEMLGVIQNHQAELGTQRKQLASQVQARTKELATERDKALAATEAKSRFLANMSHEIRTPMNAMIGMLSLLENAPLEKNDKSYLQTAITSSNNLLNIINDILDYSKIEAGKLTLENIEFDLCQLMQEVAALFANAAEQKQLHLNCSIPAVVNCQVQGDPTRLRQILHNLISNAVKFTLVGHITLAVDLLHTTAQGQLLKFSVSDSGIGISDNDKPLLFQSFTQLDGSTTRKYGGTGLGLTVCKQLIELMGGNIELESSPGNGAIFWFNLNLLNAKNKIRAPQPPKPYKTKTNKRFQGKILLTDDDPINQKVALAMLAAVGLSAETAYDGEQAVHLVHEHHYDLILMDCQMPKMDGYQATQRIRELHKGLDPIPIIGITANVMPEDRQKCIDSGMDDYLPKPVTLTSFIECLEQWLPVNTPIVKQAPCEKNQQLSATILWNKQATLANIMNDEGLLREIIDIFLRQYPLLLSNINAAIETQDAIALKNAAHALKGSIVNFSTQHILERILQLEQKARDNDFSDVAVCFQRLQQLINSFAEQLQDF